MYFFPLTNLYIFFSKQLGTSSNQNVLRDVAQPIIGHPSNHCSAAQLNGTEDVFISDKWGDISSDELSEALMLEAALFGEIIILRGFHLCLICIIIQRKISILVRSVYPVQCHNYQVTLSC
ncbi:hypothetical protein Ahy_A05g022955 [Arachis hypogaea]|uniref:Uncharacterized protein n=1 Tax=Arachis hypogaea TaxID=3818 RepID=A0A445D206_ARAHY|nr:hypothetical protein Ahy_A05g022955 [Arachis hypogaea]